MSYTICVNMPGCLPEVEPYEVETLEDAREALCDELRRTAEADPAAANVTEEVLGEFLAAVRQFPDTGGQVGLGNYVHTLERTETP